MYYTNQRKSTPYATPQLTKFHKKMRVSSHPHFPLAYPNTVKTFRTKPDYSAGASKAAAASSSFKV